jgi:hypothetical protein
MAPRLAEPAPNPRAKTALLGLAGSILTFVSLWLGGGALYIWIVAGVAPHRQVLQGGSGIIAAWLMGGLFGIMHLLGTLFFEPQGPWGIVGATVGLGLLWGFAVRRARKHARRERT